MRAITYDAPNAEPVLADLPAPACPPDGVVLDVGATGVCRSDWHAWRGYEQVPLPHVPGHEFAGTVREVGAEVTTWRPGDRVTAPFVLGCGACDYCRAGEGQVCPRQEQLGFTVPGSYAEQVAVPRAEANLVLLPEGMDFVVAASLGCRFATAFRALTRHGRVGEGDWVAVHGCGGVGLAAVMIARAFGARVVAVDPSGAARRRAADLGAEHCLEVGSDIRVERTVRDLTDGGAHVSIDAVGHPDTAAASVRSLRPRGRHVQVGLLGGDAATPRVPMARVLAFELEIYGSHGMAAADYPVMLEMVAAGRLCPELLVGRTIPLTEAGAALVAGGEASATGGMTVVDLTLA